MAYDVEASKRSGDRVMVYVCVTCGKEDETGDTAGRRMLAAISAADMPHDE